MTTRSARHVSSQHEDPSLIPHVTLPSPAMPGLASTGYDDAYNPNREKRRLRQALKASIERRHATSRRNSPSRYHSGNAIRASLVRPVPTCARRRVLCSNGRYTLPIKAANGNRKRPGSPRCCFVGSLAAEQKHHWRAERHGSVFMPAFFARRHGVPVRYRGRRPRRLVRRNSMGIVAN